MSININRLKEPAYGVYISQLIRYATTSSTYSDFLKHHFYLRNRLLDQGYNKCITTGVTNGAEIHIVVVRQYEFLLH
jgi:hypothetical protein